jgi:phenylpropionate dioxygenase-like ring-hydroxylating dioxygenase large terminal subunit
MNLDMSDLRQRDKGLIDNWYIACTSSELNSKPISRMIYDKSYVLFRDENLNSVCLLNRCLHRLTTLDKGEVVNGKLLCPYHGWSYDNKGEVVNIPSEGQGPPKTKFCQKALPICEKDGVIWVWMGEEEPEAAPTWNFPKYNDEGWVHYFMITDFENEVTNLCENFMDVPHTVYVHKGWFRNKSSKLVPMTVSTKDAKVLVTYKQEQDKIGGIFHKLLNPDNKPMHHTDEFIYPNITRVDYIFGNYGFIINSQNTPVSSLKSRTYTYIAYKIKFGNKILKPFMNYYTRQVINQDVDIMKIQSDALKIDPTENFRSTEADAPHIAIERLRQFGRTRNEKLYTFTEEKDSQFWI